MVSKFRDKNGELIEEDKTARLTLASGYKPIGKIIQVSEEQTTIVASQGAIFGRPHIDVEIIE